MKTFPPHAWFGFVLLVVSTFGENCVEAQDPPASTPAAQPATPPKQVDVPVTPLKAGKADKANAKAAEGKSSGESSESKSQRGPYVIGPEDSLSIRVWDQPNLSGPVTVGPDGIISLPLIDEVKAEGLTTEQLKRVLTEKLKGFINEPDVNVLVLRVNSRKFFIQGEVNRPGSFPLTGATTFLEALIYAGGFREFANTKRIYLLRQEEDGNGKKSEPKKYKFNYKDVSQGKHMEQNILIKSGDQIFVP